MNQNIFQIFSDIIGSIKNLFGIIAFFYQKAIEFIPFLDYILIFIVCVVLFKIILDKITAFSNSYFENINSFSLTTYRVLIPNNKKENDEDNKKDLKQVLASLESFFYNIAGIEPEYSKSGLLNAFKRYFKGRSDHFSMEIVNDEEDLITFFFSVPKSLDNMITQQIIAVWPDAFIEKVVDYDIFGKNNNTIATSATLLKHYAFPLKTYQNFETDPLDLLLNSISKFTKGDGVMIQILARSAYPSWRSYGKKIVNLLNDGRTIEQALASVNRKGFFKKFMNFLSYANGNYDKAKENFTHKSTPAEEEVIKSIEAKSSKPGMDVNLRVLVSTNEKDKNKIKDKIKNVTDSFSQYGHFGLLNNFKFSNIKPKRQRKLINKIVYRKFDENASFVLSSDELITLFHFPLETTDIPNVRWLLSRSAPAIFTCPEDGTIVGINTYGGTKKTIKISVEDRLKHMYVIGKSGTGKTSIMKDMAIQDIANGYGVAIIDPHGDFADAVLSYVPKERAHDVVFFDPSDLTRPFGLNLFEYDRNFPEQKTLIINQFIEMLYTMYDQEQIGGPMFEYYTKNALALNMEDPESGNTMIEISRVMADKEFRHMKLEKCADPIIKNFWLKEAEKAGGEAALENIVPYITSKLNQFIQNEFMRNVVGQQNSTINFSDIMNTKKILICKFAKGEIGDMNAQLLGLNSCWKIVNISA